MHISKLCLRNYRNFRNCELRFTKGVNTIIGENGSGKTNIMQAIRILLDESLPRNYKFYESDFNRSLSNWKGHWIILQIFFEELDHGDEAQALAIHRMGSPDEYDSTKGSCTIYFRPKVHIRKQLHELDSLFSTEDDLNKILSTITISDYETVYRSRGNVHFSDDEIYKTNVGDFEGLVFPNPEDQQEDIFGNTLYITNLTRELSCIFIKALRDVESDLRSYRDNPLINLLRGKEKTIEVAKKDDIVNRIEGLNNEISDLNEVKEVSEGISGSIKSSVGETYAPGLSIKSELPADMEKLMQSLKLWVGDSTDEPYQGRIGELSLGGSNLIYLATKLLEFEKVKSMDKAANFLLIEEPEAHIHTHIQKTLFRKIPEEKTQVIISTHSTHISSVSKISSVNILSKYSNYVEVYSPSNKLDSSSINKIERYLDAIRSTLLFSKSVVMVEGDAEQILIPEMFSKTFGITLDELGISLINIGSTGFRNLAVLFHDDRIKKPCAIITDLDKSMIALPADPETDNADQKSARNAQANGLQRKSRLETLASDNNHIEVFFAKYTFEVHFLKASNLYEVTGVIDEKFKLSTATKVKSKIESSDISVSGPEIIRIANQFGKGWFALMIAEKVTHKTFFPSYIRKGLRFAAQHITLPQAKNMSIKLYTMLFVDPFKDDTTDYSEILRQLPAINKLDILIDLLKKLAPQDELTKFLTD